MQRRLGAILLLIAIIVFAILASLGGKEAYHASGLSHPGLATATSAAQEFHVQLTLTAAEAATLPERTLPIP